jgi:hypothetical protein
MSRSPASVNFPLGRNSIAPGDALTWAPLGTFASPAGNGSHRKFVYEGRREGYGASGSSGRLYEKDAKRLAKFFGYRTLQDFQIAVASRTLIAA